MQKGVTSQQWIFILLGVIVVGAIAGAYFIGAQGLKNKPTPTTIMLQTSSPEATNNVVDTRQATPKATAKSIATPTATATPTVTPAPKVTLKPIYLILPTPTPTLAPLKIIKQINF